MKVLQINAVYEEYSTGRTTKELHEYLLEQGVDSYVASPNLNGLQEKCYKIGNKLDRKCHAVLSRILGLQGYFSHIATYKFLNYMKKLKPDIVILRNLHSNYMNVPLLLKYLGNNDIATIVVLHDCWFYTGKCVHYIQDGCNRWKAQCGDCPALRKGNSSLFFDRSKKMLGDKRKYFGNIRHLAVVGVSRWVTKDAAESIVGNAEIIQCINNWIDLRLFAPQNSENLRKELDLQGKFIILGVAASWNNMKGSLLFDEIANVLPKEYQIVLVGDVSGLEKKNEKIKYIGTVKDVKRLSELYSMADVFVNPTVQETFGKTTAEALACGTPVVAYDGTATPELVGRDGQCGYLIDKLDSLCFSEMIMRIKNDGKEAYQKACRERAMVLFDKEKNIKEYIKIVNRLTKKVEG